MEFKESFLLEKNPQSNAIIERIHFTILNMLHSLELQDCIWDEEDWIWDIYLAKISWAIRSTFNTITKYIPGQSVFNYDMILQTQRLINWDLIISNKRNTAIRNNLQENNKRIAWNCKVGDKVLLDYKHRKLDKPYLGPYDILQINSNGTIVIQKGRNELTVNIRQLHPFCRRSCSN